jgi:hypothetical protein
MIIIYCLQQKKLLIWLVIEDKAAVIKVTHPFSKYFTQIYFRE